MFSSTQIEKKGLWISCSNLETEFSKMCASYSGNWGERDVKKEVKLPSFLHMAHVKLLVSLYVKKGWL